MQTLKQVGVIWLHWLLRVRHITTVMLYAPISNSYKFWKSITNVFHVEGDNYRFRSPDKAFASRFFSWFLHLRSLAWNSLAASVDDMLLPNCWAQTSAHFCHDEHLIREIRNTIQSPNHIFIIFFSTRNKWGTLLSKVSYSVHL